MAYLDCVIKVSEGFIKESIDILIGKWESMRVLQPVPGVGREAQFIVSLQEFLSRSIMHRQQIK